MTLYYNSGLAGDPEGGVILPMYGEPVVGSLLCNWKQVCEDFLGVLPLDMKGQRSSLSWLTEQFLKLPPDADVVNVHRYA